MAKFVDKDFDVKEAEVAATDASFKWRPGSISNLLGSIGGGYLRRGGKRGG